MTTVYVIRKFIKLANMKSYFITLLARGLIGENFNDHIYKYDIYNLRNRESFNFTHKVQ